jgi:hypothetical protein
MVGTIIDVRPARNSACGAKRFVTAFCWRVSEFGPDLEIAQLGGWLSASYAGVCRAPLARAAEDCGPDAGRVNEAAPHS